MGAELFHADGRTDRHDKVNSHFAKFCVCSLNTNGALIVFVLSFQNYNNMEFGIVRLIGIFVVGKFALILNVITELNLSNTKFRSCVYWC
jgi:hypothetical protein